MTNKIKVTINFETNRILEEDIKEFGNKKPSGEINTNEFLCNIAIRMYEKRITEKEYYLEQFKCFFDDIDAADTIANKAIALKNNLKKNTLSFYQVLNHTIMLYTNKYNQNYINEIEINGAGKNNTSLSAYFRSLFNEYASKSKIEREKIYFRDTIEKLRCAQRSEKITILTYKQKKYSIAIESIFDDFNKYNMYVYAIDLSNNNPIALKINKIRDILIADERYRTSESECDSMEDRWCSGDIDSFDELLEIHFELTQDGKKKFNDEFYKQKYNPDIRNNKETTYCKTTREFFFNYFVSYGSDIKVISPESVVKRFSDFYEHSHKNFNK